MKNKWVVFAGLSLVLGIVGFDVGSIYQSKRYIASNKGVSNSDFPLRPEQKFYLLTRSSSSVVFASDDDSCVFKLFINKPYQSSWRKYIPFLSQLSKTRKYYKTRKDRLTACANAQALLPDQTAVLYYHLAPTDCIGWKIKLYGECGAVFTVDLDQAEYYIQRKAIVASEYFKTVALDKAQTALSKLIAFTKERYSAGIVMVDLQLESNFGFIDDEPVRLDIEHLRRDSKWVKNHHQHFAEQTASFRRWLEYNRPQLLGHYDAILKPFF
ncbi:MAG TPA: hypothetical protein PLO43_02975 [Chlamydiales bacterium]|nr:hypothetical protein [Chlamydiales bacterium]HPE85122.1 hypothetical protein [Chlamydiales bacterium]